MVLETFLNISFHQQILGSAFFVTMDVISSCSFLGESVCGLHICKAIFHICEQEEVKDDIILRPPDAGSIDSREHIKSHRYPATWTAKERKQWKHKSIFDDPSTTNLVEIANDATEPITSRTVSPVQHLQHRVDLSSFDSSWGFRIDIQQRNRRNAPQYVGSFTAPDGEKLQQKATSLHWGFAPHIVFLSMYPDGESYNSTTGVSEGTYEEAFNRSLTREHCRGTGKDWKDTYETWKANHDFETTTKIAKWKREALHNTTENFPGTQSNCEKWQRICNQLGGLVLKNHRLNRIKEVSTAANSSTELSSQDRAPKTAQGTGQKDSASRDEADQGAVGTSGQGAEGRGPPLAGAASPGL